MTVCPRCSKENEAHYKFCLGCGAPLTAGSAAPQAAIRHTATSMPPAPARLSSAPAAGPVGAPKPPPVPSLGNRAAVPATAAMKKKGGIPCPACGHEVEKGFRFCGVCGHPMESPGGSTGVSQQGSLVVIRPDGSEGESFPLTDGAVVGRDAGPMFAGDAYLSPRHALFRTEQGSLWIEDLGSLNGVYVRLKVDRAHPLRPGTVFRIGQEIVRFETLPLPVAVADGVERMGSPNRGFLGRIALVTGRDTIGNAYCVPPDGLYLGRERGDIIFPDDGYVSGLHCRIHGEVGAVFITDVGSSNGTFVRAPRELVLEPGVMLLLGQQLFRLES